MKKAQAKKLGLQTVQKQLKKPIDGNNQVKSDQKKHIEQKKTSDLKNTVNTPYKEKKNIESHTKTKSNLLTKNIESSSKKRKPEDYSKAIKHSKTQSNLLTKNTELFSKKCQMEEFSKTIRQKQNYFANKKTTKNQSPKNSISSNNNESSQLTRSVQGKPRFSFIKTTNITNKGSTHKTNQTDNNNNIKKSNTMQENNPQRNRINNAIIDTQINPDSKNIQTPKGIEKGNKSFNIGATPKKQQNNNPLSRKSSKKILEGNKKKDIKIDETNNKKRTLTDGKTQETLLNEEKKLQNVGSMVDAKKPETSITESKQGDLSNEIEIEKSYTYCNSHSL